MAESAMCDEVTTLAAGLALDAIDDADRARVEEHAAQCPRCAAALQEFREVAFALGSAVPQVDPPKPLRNRVLLAAQRERPAAAVSRPRRFGWRTSPAWAIAAAALIVSASSLIWVGRLEAEVGQLRADAASERDRAARYERVATVLASPQLAVRSLTPAVQNVHSYGTVYMDPSTGTGMITARGLPPIESGHAWQLWFVRGNERFSGGLLWPDHYGNGYALIQVPPDLQSFEGIGVTDEPGAGSAWPTTPRIMGARLN
ncbi:MAG TPA: anti-sigma factor [Chloroflexota bacterium]|nr:anti-sigma factor [Chloroflexota bacterium]